jgi:DNA-directed RNA polymerase subunit RPC12/RpoP
MKTLNKIYQCGHCGTVHPYKNMANECCGGYSETSYQCSECGILFHKKPSGKCMECGK